MKDVENKVFPNMIRTRKIGKNILVTTETGSWAALSPSEYEALRLDKLEENPNLRALLEDKGIILTERNMEGVIDGYRKRKIFLFQGTSLHIVVPTLRCNHKCIYCHSKARRVDEKGYDMNEQTAKKIVDFIFQSPSPTISMEFQGGEPLLVFPIVKYVIERSKEVNKEFGKRVKFNIVTNMTLMTDDIAQYLMNKRVGICTSLDGVKSVHNRNRKYCDGNSYDKVTNWVKKLKKEYHYTPHIITVVTKKALPYWKETVDEYSNLGVNHVWIKYPNNLGYAQSDWKNIACDPEEYFDFWKRVLDYIVTVKSGMIEITSYYLIKKILREEDPLYVDLQSPCGAAIGQLAYDQRGDIYTCDEARMFEEFKLGNVNENTYKDVLTSKKTCTIMAASTNDTLPCDSCAWKPYCGVCPVCAFASQGSLITKLPEDQRCKILNKQFTYIFEKMLSDEKYREIFLKWAKIDIFK